ncbi:MAG: UvrD-helicase domain-containing protein [Treponema sp.]|jgi:ATP-dependent helicase/nuclease subunit A|nr:UvrD-helicase domain-containing protein [Treponema sp.]
MSYEAILNKLDDEQKIAATHGGNTVVSAGAGSGKTKVLAARYAWLVMEKNYKVDEILTLTFTNKAVSEMYSRIYHLLAEEKDNPNAQRAIEDFHKANISTLDSFCARIARTASRYYGISTDFVIDDKGVRELALEAALPFVLEHRNNPALQLLMANKKIKTVSDELFANAVLKYSPISNPVDFNAFKDIQGKEILRQWSAKTRTADTLIAGIEDELDRIPSDCKYVMYKKLSELFRESPPSAPDVRPLMKRNGFFTNDPSDPPDNHNAGAVKNAETEIIRYLDFISRLVSISINHTAQLEGIIERMQELKGDDGLYAQLESIANFILQCGIVASVFPLVDKFQKQFSKKKREAGMLSFNDVAHLAVDALVKYPEIRQVYKDSIHKIMIDEFQDNNGLQRDLIFLLAEKPERQDKSVPSATELCGDKLFFVGDEKQSIYRFRGADVSVFRSLAQEFALLFPSGRLNLSHNYRSKPLLIDAFNRVFGGLLPEPYSEMAVSEPDTFAQSFFLVGGEDAVFLASSPELPNYEASYSRIYASPKPPDDQDYPVMNFCLLDAGRIDKNDPQKFTNYDIEAAYIAIQIKKMVETDRYKVLDRSDEGEYYRSCSYHDFAVLQRSYTHQHSLEQQFKNFQIPYNADRPAGLFNEAPINDICCLLRLLVYPNDRLSYAALLRSPFLRLSDLAVSTCILYEAGMPFDDAVDEKIPAQEREYYREARRWYNDLREQAKTQPLTEILTHLWYYEGYRYETVWAPASQAYEELFDLFFELAHDADQRHKSLAEFLDYLDDLISQEEKPDDIDIPAEGKAGVRIMSIHKSKGLEFSVVFVFGAGSRGALDRNTDSIYFHNTWGITLNLPQAEELSGNGKNFFYALEQEEEDKKRIAELRRLLYVALTRAESAVFITGTVPEQTREEKNEKDLSGAEYNSALIKERLAHLHLKKKDKGSIYSFIDLLLPVLNADEYTPYTISAIPAYTREKLRGLIRGRHESNTGRSMIQAAENADMFYKNAEVLSLPEVQISVLNASELDDYDQDRIDAPNQEDDDIAEALKKAGLTPADFGTMVHSYLEKLINGQTPGILEGPEENDAVHKYAEQMAQGFFESELGKLIARYTSRKEGYVKTEFPVITLVKVKGKEFTVRGQIDILFEHEGCIHIVDFKTDSNEIFSRHINQMAVYKRAVEDIFKKPVRCSLFYLRSCRGEDITDKLSRITVEESVLQFCQRLKKLATFNQQFNIYH